MAPAIPKSLKKDKIFRDTIHGYVNIPVEYCDSFIDTEIFQRLRQIEQTSMRVLYPCAHHDRFTHSIGVFHLGAKAFSYLRQNSEGIFPNITPDKWNSLKHTFQVACLLHDCGHAPFSHTFEYFYDTPELDHELKDLMSSGDPDFAKDYDTSFSQKKPGEHERVSAIILLRTYRKKISTLGADPYLAARMIIGCKYTAPKKHQLLSLKNCLIEYLNGPLIDVDKLDYILRDTWASGASNLVVDVQRLLEALCVRRQAVNIWVIAYRKSALSVIKNAIDGRNFLYRWIYSHPKVIYDQELLKTAFQKIIGRLGTRDEVLKLFSVEAFYNPITLKQFTFYQPSDADIIHLLKYFRREVPEAEEWLSRDHQYKPLWKTELEFCDIFQQHAYGKEKRAQLLMSANKHRDKFSARVYDVSPKTVKIKDHPVFIEADGKLILHPQFTELDGIPIYHPLHVSVDSDMILYSQGKHKPFKKNSRHSILSNHLEAGKHFFFYVPASKLKLKDNIIREIKAGVKHK